MERLVALYPVFPFYSMRSPGKLLDSTECVGVQGSIFAEIEKNGFSENGKRSKVIEIDTSDRASFYARNVGNAKIVIDIIAHDANGLLPIACFDPVVKIAQNTLNILKVDKGHHSTEVFDPLNPTWETGRVRPTKIRSLGIARPLKRSQEMTATSVHSNGSFGGSLSYV